jgi:hypothetical protein
VTAATRHSPSGDEEEEKTIGKMGEQTAFRRSGANTSERGYSDGRPPTSFGLVAVPVLQVGVTHDRGGPFRPVGGILRKYCPLILSQDPCRPEKRIRTYGPHDASVDDTSSVIHHPSWARKARPKLGRCTTRRSMIHRPSSRSKRFYSTIAVIIIDGTNVSPCDSLAPTTFSTWSGQPVRGHTSDMDGRYQ